MLFTRTKHNMLLLLCFDNNNKNVSCVILNFLCVWILLTWNTPSLLLGEWHHQHWSSSTLTGMQTAQVHSEQGRER